MIPATKFKILLELTDTAAVSLVCYDDIRDVVEGFQVNLPPGASLPRRLTAASQVSVAVAIHCF